MTKLFPETLANQELLRIDVDFLVHLCDSLWKLGFVRSDYIGTNHHKLFASHVICLLQRCNHINEIHMHKVVSHQLGV